MDACTINRALHFSIRKLQRLADAKAHMFHMLFSHQIEFQNVKQNPNNSWLSANEVHCVDTFTICSQSLPVFDWGLVFISQADSKQQYYSNTDPVCVSDRYQLSQHFRTLSSILVAKLVFTLYTLTIVDGFALKYAALAYDA